MRSTPQVKQRRADGRSQGARNFTVNALIDEVVAGDHVVAGEMTNVPETLALTQTEPRDFRDACVRVERRAKTRKHRAHCASRQRP